MSETYVISFVDQVLTTKKEDPNADTSALERQIDEMVYKPKKCSSSYKAEEEIKIIEGM